MSFQLAHRCKVLTGPDGILGAVGSTPLVSIEGIYAKVESVNPTGSMKDRTAIRAVRKAERTGELRPGGTIIEATSGNTGISLAMISALRGYRFIGVMPETVTREKQLMMKRFGAQVVLTPAADGIAGALLECRALVGRNPEAWFPNQFVNPDNIAHNAEGLGKEIVAQTNGFVDAFFAGVGTGGTLLGVARALRRVNPDVEIIAVEPEESAVLSGEPASQHGIEGIGEAFVPDPVSKNRHLIDRVVAVPSADALQMTRRLARSHGLWAGISSGANVLAALEVQREGCTVITVLPDSGERYLSVMDTAQSSPTSFERLSCVLTQRLSGGRKRALQN